MYLQKIIESNTILLQKSKDVEGRKLPPIAASELKLVCDPGLEALGKILRRNGIDTVIGESVSEVLYAAQNEDRIALSMAWHFQAVSNKSYC